MEIKKIKEVKENIENKFNLLNGEITIRFFKTTLLEVFEEYKNDIFEKKEEVLHLFNKWNKEENSTELKEIIIYGYICSKIIKKQ